MNFWNEQKIREALPDARLYNFPPNWSASGLIIWHDNIKDDSIILVRREGETRGILLKDIPRLLPQVSAILCTNAIEFFKYNKPIIEIHGNSGMAIINFARYIRKHFNGKVCAVTGSSGKTTTTQLVYNLLSIQYKISANLNKYNTSWGISWNMSCFDINSDFWVIETSLGGGMGRNSAITKPNYALVMNIAPVHLEEGMTLKDIADEKSKIFNSMQENSVAVIYRESAYFERIRDAAAYKNLKIITFGESADADIRVMDDNCFLIKGEIVRLDAPSLAKHILLDMAAAIAVALEENIPINDIMDTLKLFTPLSGRGAEKNITFQDGKTFVLVDESYNANPISMKAAIEGFGALHKETDKILILGDMAEGGKDSLKYHAELAEPVRKIKPQKVILCGKDIKELYNVIKNECQCYYFESFEEMNKNLEVLIDNGSYVLVKSSNSSKLYKTVEWLSTLG